MKTILDHTAIVIDRTGLPTVYQTLSKAIEIADGQPGSQYFPLPSGVGMVAAETLADRAFDAGHAAAVDALAREWDADMAAHEAAVSNLDRQISAIHAERLPQPAGAQS